MPEATNNSLRENWKCLAACTLVSMCPFQYGIDFGLIGGLQAMVGFLQVFGHRDPLIPLGWNISPGRQQLISSLMTLGAFVSSSTAGWIAAVVGRKPSLWGASVLCWVSTIIMQTTTTIGGLYAGRLLIGLANGIFMTMSQLYIQECTPARYRGLMISAFQVWTSVGTLVGTIVDNFTSKIHGRGSYQIPLGLIYIVPALMSFGLFFIPESPRWLLQHNKREKARKSLLWLRPKPEQVESELEDMQAALNMEADLARSAAVWDMFTNKIDRRRTVLAVAAVSTQAASGAMFMIAYGTYFFEMANIGNAFQNSCILVSIGVLAILINSAVVTKIGRRRAFLINGLIICGVTQLLVAIVYTVHPGTVPTGKAIVALSVLYILGYNGMIASYAWVSGAELPSQRLRSFTFGFAAAVGFLGAWLATFTAPYFINPDALNWGPKYGYIWAPSCLVTALWVYLFLPEVKDRTLEEIDKMFELRLPARKFRHYVFEENIHDNIEKESRKSSDVVVIEDVGGKASTTTAENTEEKV